MEKNRTAIRWSFVSATFGNLKVIFSDLLKK